MDTHAEPSASFLAPAPSTTEGQALFDGDLADMGFVMNLSRLWAYQPSAQHGLGELMAQAVDAASLSFRQRGILVTATASAMGDAYCSLAWGQRLAREAGDDVAASVLRGDDEALDPADHALARWARQVARDPNGTTAQDVDALRAAGYDDAQIFAITCYVAFRLAFSTINDALGTLPDHDLAQSVPGPVRDAVTFGRPIGAAPG
jgi:uncharacterized peroxidase-related enzyme